MNTQYFPQFIRLNYPVLKYEDNELLIELGDAFKEYLQELFVDKQDKLDDIWNIDPKYVIMNKVNRKPFMVNGYHPAIFIHFDNFVCKMKREAQEQEAKK